MRLIIIASVNDRAESCNLLDHRTGKALSECTGRKLYFIHPLLCIDRTACLVRQINSGQMPEVEQ